MTWICLDTLWIPRKLFRIETWNKCFSIRNATFRSSYKSATFRSSYKSAIRIELLSIHNGPYLPTGTVILDFLQVLGLSGIFDLACQKQDVNVSEKNSLSANLWENSLQALIKCTWIMYKFCFPWLFCKKMTHYRHAACERIADFHSMSV